MLKSDQNDLMKEAVPEDFVYIDYDKEFAEMVSQYVIKPFGKALNQDLLEVFTLKLDLNEAIVKNLKASAIIDGVRKTQRKP